MNHISETIANSQLDKSFNPIANSQSVATVDQLLIEYSALIEPQFAKWFAKCFYTMQPEVVHKLASEAKVDGKYPKRLFAYLVRKYAKSTRI